jgi:hypothetical protein
VTVSSSKAAAIVAALISAVFLVLIGTGQSATGPCGTRSTGAPTKVAWVWMENKAYSSVIGSSNAPYLNGLAAQCGLATNYHAITHPSLGNYIAATAGSTLSISSDCLPSSCSRSASSIFSQGWMKSYEESMPSNCYLSNSGSYAPKHNPEVYFTNIRTGCRNGGDVPLGSPSSGNLRSDLNAGALPKFSFITPNLCHDTHDCSVRTGDDYLKSLIPVILASPDYTNGRLAVVVTWDENDGSSGNRVPAVIVSPYTNVGQRSSTSFSHYSLLKSTEALLGLSCLRNACTANSMLGFF